MIDQHILKYHWEEPPTEMEFQMPFSELVGELENLIFKKDKNKEDYIKIYIKTPFLVSTALDLHVERKIDPTIYPLRSNIGQPQQPRILAPWVHGSGQIELYPTKLQIPDRLPMVHQPDELTSLIQKDRARW